MSIERAILCGDVSNAKLPLGGEQPIHLHLWGPRKNVTLNIDDIRRTMLSEVPSQFQDLLEIATYVYCADQAVSRGGDGVDNFGADWRRKLFFRIPVRHPDLWSGNDLMALLCSTLGFLTEDEFSFEFVKLKKAPSFQQYLTYSDVALPKSPEEVVLFSGGLDSLGGAIQESIIDKRNIVLVTHKIQKLAKKQRYLGKLLTQRCQDAPPVCIPVGVKKGKALTHEYTQRSRSFLYAALGATIAQMIGLSRIRFYENGVVSLNLPPSGQVVGARATRTTHPRTLNNFASLLSAIANKKFTVENPFLWRTKKEVLDLIAEAGCSDMIKASTSCTHTWDMTRLHTHCGTCSQCIDRRFAVLAAGLENNDPAVAYKVDLLTDERSEGESRTMLASYVETASEITKMSAVEFFSRFGEASRILRHLNGSSDSTGLKLFELYKRHAQHVTKVVDSGIAKHSTAIRERKLPSSCLLRLVCDSVVSDTASVLPEKEIPKVLSDYTFRKKGQAWEVRFAGREDFILLPSKGAAYLHILLSSPRTRFSAIDIVFGIAKEPTMYALGTAGKASDKDALSAYRAKYEQLKEDLEEAKQNDDSEEQSRIREEMSWLAEQIKTDQGLGGRIRKESDDRDRVRKSFRAAIRRAIAEISKYDKQLAEHLSPAIQCGWDPWYNPQTKIQWDT